MKELDWKDAAFTAAGFVGGVAGNKFRRFIQKREKDDDEDWSGVQWGSLAGSVGSLLGIVFDVREAAEFSIGVGVGATVDDVQHNLSRKKSRPLKIMGESTLPARWEGRIEINPGLPEIEKEKIVIPLLRDLAIQSSPNPPMLLQPKYALPEEVKQRCIQAAKLMTDLLKIDPWNPPTLIRIQRWFIEEGLKKNGYEQNEAMSHPDPNLRRGDVDRFRLLPALLDNWEATGRLTYDCDDSVFSFNGISFFNGIPAYAGLVSQREDRALHHVFPISMLEPGRLWGLECIKNIPPFPINKIQEVYGGLTRFVLLYPDGHWEERRL